MGLPLHSLLPSQSGIQCMHVSRKEELHILRPHENRDVRGTVKIAAASAEVREILVHSSLKESPLLNCLQTLDQKIPMQVSVDLM